MQFSLFQRRNQCIRVMHMEPWPMEFLKNQRTSRKEPTFTRGPLLVLRKISKTGSWQLFHSERDLHKTPELELITKSKNSLVTAHNRCEGNLCMFELMEMWVFIIVMQYACQGPQRPESGSGISLVSIEDLMHNKESCCMGIEYRYECVHYRTS